MEILSLSPSQNFDGMHWHDEVFRFVQQCMELPEKKETA